MLDEFLLAREQGPDHSTKETTPDVALHSPDPFCFCAKDKCTKRPAKRQAKHADSNNLTSAHRLAPLSIPSFMSLLAI
jgi:hypothetical protein